MEINLCNSKDNYLELRKTICFERNILPAVIEDNAALISR